MKPEQLFRRTRKSEDIESIQLELGSNYLKLVKQYFLEDFMYANEILESVKQVCDFLHEYKSYHIGYFLEDGRFYSFSGLSSLKHVQFNSENLVDTYKVAMIGSAFMPQKSLFIDIDKSSDDFESVFVQSISDLDDVKGRIYVASNIQTLIDRLTFYMVGAQENISIV